MPAPRTSSRHKYYYQHDPSTSPYAYSNVPGFTEHMDTGSQVALDQQRADHRLQPQHL